MIESWIERIGSTHIQDGLRPTYQIKNLGENLTHFSNRYRVDYIYYFLRIIYMPIFSLKSP